MPDAEVGNTLVGVLQWVAGPDPATWRRPVTDRAHTTLRHQ